MSEAIRGGPLGWGVGGVRGGGHKRFHQGHALLNYPQQVSGPICMRLLLKRDGDKSPAVLVLTAEYQRAISLAGELLPSRRGQTFLFAGGVGGGHLLGGHPGCVGTSGRFTSAQEHTSGRLNRYSAGLYRWLG